MSYTKPGEILENMRVEKRERIITQIQKLEKLADILPCSSEGEKAALKARALREEYQIYWP